MKKLNSAKDHIILALDVSSEQEALNFVYELTEYVGMFKIGLELINSQGLGIVRKITEMGGKIFLDGKFHDIPNTVAGASKAMTRLGVSMFNIHTMGGFEMMSAAVQAAREEASLLQKNPPLILGVTILTSIEQTRMNNEMRIPGSIEDQVIHLAKLAQKASLDGIIASPQEIDAIKKNISSSMLIVTPGVRPSWSATYDQKRIMTPAEAMNKGASYLVIGRPITNPPPEVGTSVNAAKLILDEIETLVKRNN